MQDLMSFLGLQPPASWPETVLLAAGWTALMVAVSPVADRLAGLVFEDPPNLRAFDQIKQSPAKLIAGIIVAWVLGGFLEEVFLRGVILNHLAQWLAPGIGLSAAAGFAILVAAGIGGLGHLYQGRKAALIITQLSCLFGLLFVLTDFNLWAVILAHGFYDTVAFIRYARGTSRYSKAAD